MVYSPSPLNAIRATVACAAFPRRQDAAVRLPHFMRREAHLLTHQDGVAHTEQANPYATRRAAQANAKANAETPQQAAE